MFNTFIMSLVDRPWNGGMSTTTSTSHLANSLDPTNSSTMHRRILLTTPQTPDITPRVILLGSTSTTSLRLLLPHHLYWKLYKKSDIPECDGTTSVMQMKNFTPIITLELQIAEELIYIFLSYTGSAYNFTVYFQGKISATGSPIEGTLFYISGIYTTVQVQPVHEATAGVLPLLHRWNSSIGNIHSVGK